ncbi:MAG: FMN-binding protein [Ruminococcaceae bacterium]|nr:FMN-binding protein [Oscillospiraceae bacterium]
MKTGLKNTLVLVSICAVMALLMAITHYATSPVIAENERKATQKALQQVMPEGVNFVSVLLPEGAPDTVTEAYREDGGGCVFKLKTTGYGKDLIIMCGVDASGTVTGTVCLSSSETLGFEKTFGEQFVGLDRTGAAAVDTVAGATKTTTAYRAAVADALRAAQMLRVTAGEVQ